MQKKTRRNNKAVAQNKKLSIQFSLDGFSFCILNSDTEEIITFTKYEFDKPVSSPELLLSNLMNVFASDNDLQGDFTSVFAVHQNNLATLVPEEYFDRNNLKPYLKYSVKTLPTDYITYDTLDNIEANTVYIPYVNINNYLFQNFGEFEFKHHSTVLVDKLLNLNNEHQQFYVYVNSKSIDIIVTKGKQLLFSNSFSYETKEDFLYYILFTAEQLQMDPNEFSLTFIGDIEKESELYNITYNYVRNVDFIKSNNTFFKESEEFSNHSNYILIG
ncbi:DUF3822 family protein [Tenacibaculum holothuriorum]|uniref:DUF3822 family protein n=1 Tax=Tenacibaculum holothuriorum TaxID=1635173 RepID=UPI001E4944C2|nr:DUF3822 family protein [Tenacibaculum holothuriorum]